MTTWHDLCGGFPLLDVSAPLRRSRRGTADARTAEELLSVAVEADLMSRFLELAAGKGMPVLGYVSAVNLIRSGHLAGDLEVMVRPCVVLVDSQDEPAARQLLHAALENSSICRSLTNVRLEGTFVSTHQKRGRDLEPA